MKRTILTVGAAIALTLFVTGCGPSGAHFKEVKSAVFDGNEKLNTSVEVSLGVVPLWLAGTVAGFIDEPEAKEASAYIDHISRVDVGFYEVQDSLKKQFSEISLRVRSSMLNHGFESLVQVREKNECVGVYVPTMSDKPPREIFVVVMERKEVVLVRVRGNFEKLAKTALKNHPLDLQVLDKAFREEIFL